MYPFQLSLVSSQMLSSSSHRLYVPDSGLKKPRELLTLYIGNSLRPGLSERLALKQNSPNIASVSSAGAQQSGKDGRSKVRSHRRPRINTHTPSNLSFTAKDVGFARFLHEHSSPTHQRVTAGGRIVPIGHPARPSEIIAEMSDDQMDPSGSAIDASMNGHSMNGHTMNGHTTNGHSMNGPSMNGHSMNGRTTNGHRMNGYATHGHTTNGHIMNGHGMTNLAPARSPPDGNVSAPAASGSALDGDGSGPAATVPPVSSLNPVARPFMPLPAGVLRVIRAAMAARVNPEPYQDRAVNIPRGVNEILAAWALIWPPFSWNEWAIDEIQAVMRITMHNIVYFALSPVRGSDLPQGGLLQGNPVLTFRPRQPIPLAFVRTEFLAPQLIAPLGLYWYLLTEVFRVTNEGQFRRPEYYRGNLVNLVWLVHIPRNENEVFILVHFTVWLRYHRRLFDELLASVDRRRAMIMSPDFHLTAERVYYVDQRAYVDEIIRQLEGWLLLAYRSHVCPFCRAMIWVGLNGHVVEDYVVEDSRHILARHDQGDGSGDGYDRQDGPGDVWPGNNEAPGGEEDPEFATSGGMGQAEGHAVSGPVTNSGPSQDPLTESQPARGSAEDGLEGGVHAARSWEEVCGGAGGESSSQSVDVEVGPNKGKQVALPQQLR